jgi:hypothetical protein
MIGGELDAYMGNRTAPRKGHARCGGRWADARKGIGKSASKGASKDTRLTAAAAYGAPVALEG